MNPFEGRALNVLETELVEANRVCRRTTGLVGYQDHQARRRLICDEIQKHRSLRDEEYLLAYGNEELLGMQRRRYEREATLRAGPHPSVLMVIEGEELNLTIEVGYKFVAGMKPSSDDPGQSDDYEEATVKVMLMELDLGGDVVEINALTQSGLTTVLEWASRQIDHDAFVNLCEADQAARRERTDE